MSRLLEQTTDVPFVLGWLTILAGIFTTKYVPIDSRIPILSAGMLLIAISSVLAMGQCAEKFDDLKRPPWSTVGVDWQLGHDILMMRFLATAPLIFVFLCTGAHQTVRLSSGTVLCMLCAVLALVNITLLSVCLTTIFKRAQWGPETAEFLNL